MQCGKRPGQVGRQPPYLEQLVRVLLRLGQAGQAFPFLGQLRARCNRLQQAAGIFRQAGQIIPEIRSGYTAIHLDNQIANTGF